MINNGLNQSGLLKANQMCKVLLIPIAFVLLFFSQLSFADYTFPGALPPGCSGSGGSYTCGSLTANTHYHFNDSGNVTVTVNGTFSINNYTIGDAGDSANVTFNVNDHVYISSPTIYASINAGSHNINVSGAPTIYGDLRTSTGNITMRGGMQGNIITERGDITINANSTITGDIAITGSTTTAHLNIYQDCVINGYVSVKTATSDDIEIDIYERTVINGGVYAFGQDHTDVILGLDATVNGDIVAYGDDESDVDILDRSRVTGNITSISDENNDGIVSVKPNAAVDGYVTSYGDVNNQGAIAGCTWYSNSSGATIEHYSGSSNTGGSCCGTNRNSCSSSCIVNNSGSSISLCGTVDTITVNAYGTDYFGSWPVMELWIDEVKVDSVMVDSSSAKNYVFKVDLPSSGSYKIDLVFPNDAWDYVSEDRNLRINSINYDGNTILSSDASVVRDYGNSAATYFDGVNTQGPGTDLNSAGAMRFNHSIDAELIAEYHMDETAWSGSTSDLIDTAGYTGGPFNGQSIGSPIPTPKNDTPARPGSTGTCGYAVLSGPTTGGGAFTLNSLPVNTSNGSSTSVSFWFHWDGTTQIIIPIGWDMYYLIIMDNKFGFGTYTGDLYGVNISALNTGWNHIVAVFNNGDVTKNKLYIDGVAQSLSQLRGSPTNSRAQVQSTLIAGGHTYDTIARYVGRIDELRVYRGEMSAAQVSDDYNATHTCNNAFKLLEYHMDEASWNGTTDEVVDTSGVNLHGTAAIKSGSTYPTTASTNPAISGSAGTCNYGTFNGQQYIDVSSSFINMTDSYTISTWIKPTNVNAQGQRIFADDQNNNGGYSLSLSDGSGREGKINFFKRENLNTANITSDYVLQNNQWYYIAASVSANNNKVTLYIYNQSGSLLEKKTSNIDYLNFSDSGTASIGSENAASSETKGFYGDLDEMQVHLGSRPLYQSEIEGLLSATHSCPTFVGNVDASNFTCVSLEEPNNSTGHLYMQPRNTFFGLKVIALKVDGTPETDFSAVSDKSVTLEFIDQNNSNAPIQFRDNTTDVLSKSITFPAGDATGIVTVSNLKIIPAYQNLKCQITDTNQTPTVVAQSGDNFSTRPTNITTIQSSDANADTSGVSDTNLPAIKTGETFTIQASPGVQYYNGYFSIDPNKILDHNNTVQAGALTGSFGQANVNAYGWSQSSSFSYAEVGYFKFDVLGIYDDTFTNVDSSNGDCTDDFSNTAVSGKYGCKFGNQAQSSYIGRFVPDHFTLTALSDTPSCNSNFTYYGDLDGVQTTFSLVAENASNNTVLNYDGAFANFDLTNWNNFNFSAANLPTGATLQTGSVAPSGTWSNGVASVTATHMVGKLAAPMDPRSITISAQPSYDEGSSPNSKIVSTLSSVTIASASPFRYGRLSLNNAHGSELMPLNIPLLAQYWDGAAYRQNTLDNCSAVNSNMIMLDCYSQNLNSGETTISGGGLLTNGATSLTLSAPGNGNNGSVNLTPYLTNAITSSCGDGNTPTLIDAEWFIESNLSNTPNAKATFGLHKSPVIYMRENY